MRAALSISTLMLGAVLLAASAFVLADVPSAASCPAGAHSPVLDDARAELSRDERALEPRLKLADALLAQSCYTDAVHVLEEGEPLFPRNAGIQSRLRAARSNLSEQRYFDGLGNAEANARVQRNLLRCRQLGDLAACDEALKSKPADASIVGAKADALMQADRIVEALPVYRHALDIDPSNTNLQGKLRDAETRRLALAAQCRNGDVDEALRACQLALLRGASDEFDLQARRALLLQRLDKPSQALDAFIAAGLLKPDDKAVARGVVALTESTGRNDALALAARGNALLALGRGTDAVAALKQAQQLSPTLPDVKIHLAAAEKLARTEARQKAEADARAHAELAKNAPPPPPADSVPARKYSNDGPATRSH